VVSAGDSKLDKLKRTVVEACKQCGRDELMEIAEFTPWPTFAESLPNSTIGWLLHPINEANGQVESARMAAIGPEGGWTEAEIELGRERGWMVGGLSGYILRIETAAAAAATLLGRSGSVAVQE
jgi:16S rRNA (uracil1498-N3)-methyltransferase